MSGPNASSVPTRSWTHASQTQKKRPIVVFVWVALLIGLIALFAWILWGRELPKVYVKSILIPESIQDQELQHPWNLDSLATLAEWKLLPSREVSNTAPLENALSLLPNELRDNNANSQDTLIIQIRGQALVYSKPNKDGTLSWQCGFQIAEDSKEPTKKFYSASDLFDQISKLSVKNVLVLADVCDVRSAPGSQLLINPVNHYLIEACKALQSPPNNLWIITSANDSQPSLYSDIENQTLFQRSIIESLTRHSPNQAAAFSLSEFYERLLEYCYSASNKQQTPMLIWGGIQPRFCTPSDSLWTQAENVLVARLPNTKSDSNSEDSDKPKSNRSAKNDTSVPSEESNVKFEQLSPQLQFWWLRDRIANDELSNVDEKDWHWTPTEFSPWKWRKIQRARADQDVDELFKKTPRIDGSHLDELLQIAMRIHPTLAELQKNKNPNTSISKESMLRDWESFESSPLKRLWEENDARWLPIRSQLRRYAICISESLFWRDMLRVASDITPDRTLVENLKNEFVEFLHELKKVRAMLPDDNSGFTEQYVGINMDQAWKHRTQLRTILSRITKEVAARISKTQRLTWSDEFLLRILLSSPTLPFESRSKLVGLLKECDLKELEKVTVDTDSKEEIFRGANNSNAHTKIWSTYYEKPLQLLESSAFTFRSGQDLECGAEYQTQLLNVRSQAKTTSLQYWHAENLTDLSLDLYDAIEPKQFGIVLAPVGSKNLEVTHEPSPLLFANDLREARSSLGIKRKDGTSASDGVLSVKWNKLPINQIAFLRINGKDVDPNRSSFDVNLTSNLIDIVCALRSNYQLPEGASVHLNIAEKGSSIDRAILMYQGSERIEMRVYRDNPGDAAAIELDGKKSFTLTPPAAAGSKSSFRFELINYKPVSRRARAHLKWNDKLIASSESVDLPPCLQRLEPVAIHLKADAPIDDKVIGHDIVQGSMTIEIEEFELKPNSDSSREAQPTPYRDVPLRQSPYVFDIVVRPERPSSVKLYEIQSNSVERFKKIQFTIQANPMAWNQFGIKQMPIQIRNADAKSEAPFDAVLLPNVPINFQGPVLDTRTVRLDLDVGEYPRDTMLLAELNNSHLLSKTISQFVIPSLDVVLLDSDGKEVNAVRVDDQIVVPEFKAGDNDTREIVSISKLRIKAKLDLKAAAKLVLSNDRNPKLIERDLKFDRSYPTKIEIVDGKLGMACSAREFDFELGFPKNLDSDTYRISIAMNDTAQIAKTLIIDKIPPQVGSITCTKNLFRPADKEMEVALECQDEPRIANSGLNRVEFFLRTTDSREEINKEDIPITSKVIQSDNKEKWSIRLSSEVLDSIRIPPGQIRILARSYDRAGNIQTKHKPAIFQWAP